MNRLNLLRCTRHLFHQSHNGQERVLLPKPSVLFSYMGTYILLKSTYNPYNDTDWFSFNAMPNSLQSILPSHSFCSLLPPLYWRFDISPGKPNHRHSLQMIGNPLVDNALFMEVNLSNLSTTLVHVINAVKVTSFVRGKAIL